MEKNDHLKEELHEFLLASIIIVTFNHKKYISDCLNSILKEKYPNEIILVDNCSHDGLIEFVEKSYPMVKIIRSTNNLGFGAANNLGVKCSHGEFIVFLNPDTIVRDRWLENLISPLQKHENLITTPKILNYYGSSINTCGAINHFTGLTFTQGLGKVPIEFNEPIFVSGVSGACFALKRKDFDKINGFDESFFLYNEDSDFSWRTHLSGLEIAFIPESIVYHDYTLKVSPEKLYHLERGRYFILRKYLTKTELLLILPSLLFTELLTSYYALKLGKKGISNKLQAVIDGLSHPVIKYFGDKKLLFKNLHSSIPANQLTSNNIEYYVKIVGNIIFSINYRVF